MKQGMLDMNIQTLASLQTSINPRDHVRPGNTLHRQQVNRHKHLSEWDQTYKDRLLEYYIREDDKRRSLSPSRQVEIEAWRENVSPRSNMPAANINRRSQRHSAPPKKNRSYNRIGSSRSDPGTLISKKTCFTDRGKFVEKPEDFDSLMAHMNQISLHYEAQRVKIHDRLQTPSKRDTSNNLSNINSCSERSTSVSSKNDGDTSPLSESHELNQSTLRSQSNNLLNCITIDDCPSPRQREMSGDHVFQEAEEEIINLRNSLPSRRSSKSNSANSSGRTSLKQSSIFDNSAVTRAFSAILSYRDVQENTAIRGLYRSYGSRTKTVNFGKESETFKKRKALLREHVSEKSLQLLKHRASRGKISLTAPNSLLNKDDEENDLVEWGTYSESGYPSQNRGNFLRVIMDDMEDDDDVPH